MKLSTYCIKCQKEIRFSARASDRVKLSAKLGANIELKCGACGEMAKYHVNKIYAVPNRLVTIISLMGFIGGTVLIVFYFGKYLTDLADVYAIYGIISVFAIPGMIYFTIKSVQESKSNLFNGHRI